MKKKTGLITLLLSFLMAFGLAGCDLSIFKPSKEEPTQIEKVYNQYVAYAQENGVTPLSYEQWLATIKGEQGDPGPNGTGPRHRTLHPRHSFV